MFTPPRDQVRAPARHRPECDGHDGQSDRYQTIPGSTSAGRRAADIRHIVESVNLTVSLHTGKSSCERLHACGSRRRLHLSKEPHEEDCGDILRVGLSELNSYQRMLVIFAGHVADMSYGRD